MDEGHIERAHHCKLYDEVRYIQNISYNLVEHDCTYSRALMGSARDQNLWAAWRIDPWRWSLPRRFDC